MTTPSIDLVLQFIFPDESSDADQRTFQVKQMLEGSAEPREMYKFHHPNTGTTTGVTTIQRMNAITGIWDNAGQIDWQSNTSATVYFGTERVPVRELRKRKKASSKSRRFKANSGEYKWKVGQNGRDLVCVSTRGKTVATWSDEQSTLRVVDGSDSILDRVVVTCFLNIRMLRLNFW
ncbi:uncharacterized protein LAESUDRAFT_640379 [Laetiporus sulphureus 93-53]|uniref:DUF6593 domain-containing protein n=1 Tax=Laetiporus sulphureus 93-53 TaxID=1314785 RepID=A0A165IEY6_9APHY|nr:uncharacterized protein LAESUDRAFT_640379 [Laetiporus sulphureus 93-53]KZT12982.1 hypothetical protein LAESUDRAFT_640379 [Laetiporus sulphureus 93-53]